MSQSADLSLFQRNIDPAWAFKKAKVLSIFLSDGYGTMGIIEKCDILKKHVFCVLNL